MASLSTTTRLQKMLVFMIFLMMIGVGSPLKFTSPSSLLIQFEPKIPLTFAQGNDANNNAGDAGNKAANGSDNKAVSDPSLDYFSPSQYAGDNKGTKLSIVKNLPSGDWQSILTRVIKFILAITGTLSLISFTFAGVLFLTARGEEDQLGKAKQILIWSIVALGIIAVSYAIVLGISQLKFFS